MNKQTKWRTKIIHLDIDTGEILSEKQLINYKFIKHDKKSWIHNGFGTTEYTKQYRRIYERGLFDDPELFHTFPD